MGVEQRRHPRYGVHLAVRYTNAEQFVTDYVENLSTGGLFIAGANQMPLFTETDVDIELPGQGSWKVRAKSVFIIDPKKKIRVTLTYPASTGRNFDEILRVIDSLQLTDRHKVATPVNWQVGDDVIIAPSVSNDEASRLHPGGWKEQRPYLRMVKQPA